jgi:hypothetical protein
MDAAIATLPDKEFYLANRDQIAIIYPDKWVAIYNGRILFVEDDDQVFFRRAFALGLNHTNFSYCHHSTRV